MEFGDKVKQVRKQLKLNQTEMAKLLGVAYSTLNRWENGRFKPSYDAIKKFDELCAEKDLKLN